jgi:hypothetical protein
MNPAQSGAHPVTCNRPGIAKPTCLLVLSSHDPRAVQSPDSHCTGEKEAHGGPEASLRLRSALLSQ